MMMGSSPFSISLRTHAAGDIGLVSQYGTVKSYLNVTFGNLKMFRRLRSPPVVSVDL